MHCALCIDLVRGYFKKKTLVMNFFPKNEVLFGFLFVYLPKTKAYEYYIFYQ